MSLDVFGPEGSHTTTVPVGFSQALVMRCPWCRMPIWYMGHFEEGIISIGICSSCNKPVWLVRITEPIEGEKI